MSSEAQFRALIVDDSRLARLKVSRFLNTKGIDVVAEAQDGIQAVKLFNQKKPNLVTMDLILPGIDGLIAIKKIKELDEDVRILIISSCTTQEKIEKARQMGVDCFVNKPIIDSDFELKLKEILEH